MRAVLCGIVMSATVIGGVAPAAAQSDPARATVQQLDEALLGIMKSGGSTHSRAAAIAPAIDRAIDLPLMTRLVVGPGWSAIAPADQQALLAAFRRLTIAQYAANFDSWSGETFAIAPQVESRGLDRLVRTTLTVPGRAPIAISYRLRENAGRWQIIDIFYHNAISQVALRRSDFTAVLAKGGAKALAAHLDALAAKGSF
ncbi:ABC transporter substrate-binding protein [Novosphingobium sp. FSW06-99]|uniref:ABC transporter substrate-binding protein n=1 Tax=Novosphingobium sp. FSW06-99 TaxID=1739113 RepID=UPI00076C7588|nr:ABC transporter substrate-binding protein [Novosphingobium sp. FSW06-99]KUR79022.1 hopanoid biosynthesis protein HpnM [Novosphingobium sp. FSW06-99]